MRLAPGSFFGQPKSSIALDGLLFLESAFPSNTAIPTHTHANPFFYFVLEGTCEEVDTRGTHTSEPSTLVYHPAGHVHSNQWPGQGGRCLHVEVAEPRLERLRTYAKVLMGPAEICGGAPAALALRLYREYQLRDAVSPLALEGLTLELIAETSRQPALPKRTAPFWARRARALLRERFAEELTLEGIADAVVVHPSHLARGFRKFFGCTPGDYLRQLRIDHAIRLLATTDRALCLVALEAGFTHQSHFSNSFKRRMGMSPLQYRRLVRAGKSAPRG
jgi:AraC family transcriptional regulator